MGSAGGSLEEGTPILARLATQIASRFGIVVSQEVAAQAVPVIGASGGAAVIAAFMAHFQSIARAQSVSGVLNASTGRPWCKQLTSSCVHLHPERENSDGVRAGNCERPWAKARV